MIDHEKIEQAVRLLLEGMGEDVNREGLIDTPDRIARMYEEIYGGMDEDAGKHLSKTFTVDSHEMVIEKDITFYSTCEHHLLPFYGKAHIAYIPDGKVVGLSKLARTVEVFARRLQLQEQLNRIARNYPALPTITVDGIYGPATKAAVEKFQSIFGLPVTGIVDFRTWYRISEIYVAVSRIAELYQ